MTCPQCGAERTIAANGRWQIYCSVCGYDFRKDDQESLRVAKEALDINPRDPSLWRDYAFALDINNRPKEALDALDNSLPYFPDFSWEDYLDTAFYYSMFDDARFGKRLLADGILYHLENHRDQLTPEDLETAANVLRGIAKDAKIEEFNRKSKTDRAAIRKAHLERYDVSFDEDPLPYINGLGAFELAKRFSTSSPSRRLYPGSPNMTPNARKMERRDKKIKKAVIWLGGLMLVLVSLMCMCSQCSS